MSTSLKKKIFISYRVKDTQAATGRLVDALKQHFDDDQIFMDIEKIEPGLDFTEVIPRYLDSSEVMLAIIGPDWMAYNKDKNTYRIHDQHDWVRIEIATALQRNIRVVPVLLEGASLPEEDQLPDDLKPLLRRQSYEISNKRWKFDSDQLVDFLKRILGSPAPQPQPQPVRPQPAPAPHKAKEDKTRKYWIIGAVIFAFLILLKILSEADSGENDAVQPLTSPTATQQSAPEPAVQQEQQQTPVQAPYVASIEGRWVSSLGDRAYVFAQNGQSLSVNIYDVGSGTQTGSGSGSIQGNTIKMTLSIHGYNGLSGGFDGTLTADANTINTVVTISDGSEQQSINLTLLRQ